MAKREYVQYNDRRQTQNLQVELLSDNWRDRDGGDWYDVYHDPLTGAELGWDELYDKYGLPVAKHELPLLCGAHAHASLGTGPR